MHLARLASLVTCLCSLAAHTLAVPAQDLRQKREAEETDRANYTRSITMPGIRPTSEDEYWCVPQKLSGDEEYIISYEALAEASKVHHLLVYGCTQPGAQEAWRCMSPCYKESPRIIFAWAKNAPPFNLPRDVGYEIGSDVSIQYLVVQVHYKHPIPASEPADTSGIKLTLTNQRQQYIAGIYLLLKYPPFQIPGHQPVVHADLSCEFKGAVPIYPIAYRVHAHSLGKVISAYQYNGSWYEVGKGNPQWPQAFYPVEGDFKIDTGDVMAAQCTFDSSNRNRATKIGATHNDEMCNFYLMYYTDAKFGSNYYQCQQNQYQGLMEELPADSDQPLPHNPALEEMAQGHSHSDAIEPIVPGLELMREWPKLPDNIELGQVAGVATDSSGNVHIFHRGSHKWDEQSFDLQNNFIQKDGGPIPENTVLTFDPSGNLIKQWGKDKFYLPHGLHIDHEDNIWLTDVALHQVFKYTSGSDTPSLTFGVEFQPGSDHTHFCKPTDVAVLKSGEFYISDGYCNHRVMKYAANGTFIKEWGQRTTGMGADDFPPPSAFDIPHSITALEDLQQVCVADRENGRIQCFDYDGVFQRQIHPAEFAGRLFAVTYSPSNRVLFAVNGPVISKQSPRVAGFAIDSDTNSLLETFGAGSDPNKEGNFSNPHDIATSPNGGFVYVAEIGPNKIWKFKVNKATLKDTSTHVTVKKGGVSGSGAHPSSVDNGVEDSAAEHQLEGEIKGDFGASVIIGLLLVIPVVVIIGVTVVMRLKKNGKLPFLNQNYKNRRFNIGNFFSRHKGFDRLSTEDGDELDHLNSDSDIEEYSATTHKA